MADVVQTLREDGQNEDGTYWIAHYHSGEQVFYSSSLSKRTVLEAETAWLSPNSTEEAAEDINDTYNDIEDDFSGDWYDDGNQDDY